MRKLKLDTDNLRVESFDPVAEMGPGRGTVAARAFTEATCYQFTCRVTCNRDAVTCNGDTCVTVCYTCETNCVSCPSVCNTCYTACIC